jgi:hypothetical protein
MPRNVEQFPQHLLPIQFGLFGPEKSKIENTCSDSSDTGDSETTLAPSKSCMNLRTWRSFDSLPHGAAAKKDKISAENLSEDSGYSDHMRDKNALPESLFRRLTTTARPSGGSAAISARAVRI